MKNKFRLAFLLAAFLAISAVGASAQNMANTVKTVNVKFAPGRNQTTLRGAASYAMSYVYKFKVKKGQTIAVKADSKEPELTFSVFSPKADADPLASMVKDWSGEAADAGTYSITLVMNNEKAKRVPYNLSIKIR
ncbi:MAG: hypothetical protein ACR2N3_13495 [Pyrinomonadaceae bacterium]